MESIGATTPILSDNSPMSDEARFYFRNVDVQIMGTVLRNNGSFKDMIFLASGDSYVNSVFNKKKIKKNKNILLYHLFSIYARLKFPLISVCDRFRSFWLWRSSNEKRTPDYYSRYPVTLVLLYACNTAPVLLRRTTIIVIIVTITTVVFPVQ
jgi:hypothetical protein